MIQIPVFISLLKYSNILSERLEKQQCSIELIKKWIEDDGATVIVSVLIRAVIRLGLS